MSESSSEDFSDSDSDVSQEGAANALKNGKRKVPSKNESKSVESENDSSSDDVKEPQPVKKRKTLQDYLNEKVSLLSI